MLIGLRDYQDAKADVILRYNPDEARNLKTYGELPESGIWFFTRESVLVSELAMMQILSLMSTEDQQSSFLNLSKLYTLPIL